jgi:non-ribosomal peptide synthetase component F
VFTRDLLSYYDHHASGHDVCLPDLPVSFHDYVLWHRDAYEGGAMSSQIAFWTNVLAELPPPLTLPTTKVRPPTRSFRGNTVTAHLSEVQGRKLESLARASQVSTFVMMVAAAKVLLARVANRRDVIVGAAVAGRHHPGLENLIGYFSNLLILRDDVDMTLTFSQLIERVKHTFFDALAHQDVPFDRLIDIVRAKRDLSNTPVFQVAVTYEMALAPADCASGLEVSFGEMRTANSKCDLSVNVVEQAQRLRINFNYNVDVFSENDAQALLRSYLALLNDALANPRRCIGELALGGEE